MPKTVADIQPHPALDALHHAGAAADGAVAFQGFVAPSDTEDQITLWSDLAGSLRLEIPRKAVLSVHDGEDGRVRLAVLSTAELRWTTVSGGTDAAGAFHDTLHTALAELVDDDAGGGDDPGDPAIQARPWPGRARRMEKKRRELRAYLAKHGCNICW